MNADGTTVSTSLLPVRHWWQPRLIRVVVQFDCGTRMESDVPLKWALDGLQPVQCPKCGTKTNLVSAEVLAGVVLDGFKRSGERN